MIGVWRSRGLKSTEKKTRMKLLLSYFSLGSVLILVIITASLLLMPLVLPPLPPPPLMLLLVPIGIMVVLIFLAFVPSDINNIVSSSSV